MFVSTQSLGQLGRVERLLDDGSVAVVVNGRRWILDPRCLVPVPGEQPQDEGSEYYYKENLYSKRGGAFIFSLCVNANDTVVGKLLYIYACTI